MSMIVSLPLKDSTLDGSGAGDALPSTVSGQGRVPEKQYIGNEECKPGHQEKNSSTYPARKGVCTKTWRGSSGCQGVKH